ncbi:MAG: HAD family hydrolase [Eubacteriales bacterium]|nr:HAD family hydrolase [Eubacteriales bacterium]
MKNTIIFDLDGTLLYTLEDLKNSTNYALEKFSMPKRTLDEIRAFVGNGIRLLIERAVPEGDKNPLFDDVFAAFKEHYSAHSLDFTRPYDGITDMLKVAKSRGFKTAIVSNKIDSAVKELRDVFFPGLIDVAYGESPTVNRKPAPDTVFAALAELGSDIGESVYVGDSDVDVMTAKNAGMDLIAVSWGFRDKDLLRKMGAAVIIDKPCELLSRIDEMM